MDQNSDILIADGDPAIVRVLSARCRELGLNVREAGDGIDALRILLERPPALVISEVNLAAVDGFSVCAKMTQDERLAAIPVVFLTEKSDDETIARCEELGAYHVPKSIDAWDQLKPVISRLLMIPGDPGGASPATREVPNESSPPRVLVIDDDPAIASTFRRNLRRYGVDVIEALNGTQGFWRAVKEAPDLIICDYLMPEGNGKYAMGRLRRHSLTKAVPVIILTGHGLGPDGRKDASLERDLLGTGATAMLTKPCDFDALLHELSKHIELLPQRSSRQSATLAQ